jgi:hypothetical protein
MRKSTIGKRTARMVHLLETYENRDFFYDRAKTWEDSPLNISDEFSGELIA